MIYTVFGQALYWQHSNVCNSNCHDKTANVDETLCLASTRFTCYTTRSSQSTRKTLTRQPSKPKTTKKYLCTHFTDIGFIWMRLERQNKRSGAGHTAMKNVSNIDCKPGGAYTTMCTAPPYGAIHRSVFVIWLCRHTACNDRCSTLWERVTFSKFIDAPKCSIMNVIHNRVSSYAKWRRHHHAPGWQFDRVWCNPALTK